MKIGYIGVPLALGTDRDGVEQSPDFFRRQGVIEMMNGIVPCVDLGNVESTVPVADTRSASKDVMYLETVVDVTTRLRDKVNDAIRHGFFPLTIGGDHSIGLGSTAGVALVHDNLGVVWFDAHGDFNTEETSPTGNIHGMPCAALMGWCKSPLSSVATKNIPPSNFFWVGARDLDPGEIDYARKYNLHIYSTSEVKRRGMATIVAEISDKLNEQDIAKVHLSIDIDAMDPLIVSATGTKAPDGLANEDFSVFIDRIFDTRKVVSADFVEYNRALDDTNMTTAKWCIDALCYIVSKIKGRFYKLPL